MKKNEELVKKRGLNSGAKLVLVLVLLAFISVGLYYPLKTIILPDDKYVSNYQVSESFANYLDSMMWSLLREDFDVYQTDEYENISYYFDIKDENSELLTNMNLSLDQISMKDKQASSFYIHIVTNEKFRPVVKESSMTGDFKTGMTMRIEEMFNSAENIKGKAVELFLMIPKDVYYKESRSDLAHSIKNFYLELYLILILAIGAVFTISILVWAGFTNSLKQQNNGFIKALNKIPIEIKFLIYSLFVACFLGILSFSSNYSIPVYYSSEFKFENIISDANIFFYLIGIPATIFFYTALYVLTADLKNIYHLGIYNSLIKNSIVGRICISLFKKLKSMFVNITRFDISDYKNRKFIVMLAVNALIIWAIDFFVPTALYVIFGVSRGYSIYADFIITMFVTAIYSLFIFSYLKDKVRALEQLYLITDEISKGNFNQNMDFNLGIFNPIVEKLSNINKGFKIAVDKEIKSQNLKTELISNVSHDLKTPLTSIVSYVDLLKKEENMSENQKNYIEILEQKSQRLKFLIEDLFEASKAASRNISFNKSSLDIVSLLRQSIAENENEIDKSGLLFKMNFPDAEQKIICELDGKRTYRIFDNLINNILKYSLPNSRVYIDLSLNSNKVIITFKNIASYEMNFDPNDMAERFTRGDKSRNTDGSGLGLSIAKSFTELQGGTFDIYVDGDLFKVIISFEVISD